MRFLQINLDFLQSPFLHKILVSSANSTAKFSEKTMLEIGVEHKTDRERLKTDEDDCIIPYNPCIYIGGNIVANL